MDSFFLVAYAAKEEPRVLCFGHIRKVSPALRALHIAIVAVWRISLVELGIINRWYVIFVRSGGEGGLGSLTGFISGLSYGFERIIGLISQSGSCRNPVDSPRFRGRNAHPGILLPISRLSCFSKSPEISPDLGFVRESLGSVCRVPGVSEILVQRIERSHVLGCEVEVEDLGVLADPLFVN